jgi:hypothetical protein
MTLFSVVFFVWPYLLFASPRSLAQRLTDAFGLSSSSLRSLSFVGPVARGSASGVTHPCISDSPQSVLGGTSVDFPASSISFLYAGNGFQQLDLSVPPLHIEMFTISIGYNFHNLYTSY